MWVGATSSATVSTVLNVTTVSVNFSETGANVVTIMDEGSSATTVTVAHPTVIGAENKTEQTLTLIPFKRYPFTVRQRGTTHHYRLGSKDDDLKIGEQEIRYVEVETQGWGFRVDAGESVKLTFTTDSSDGGTNQTNTYRITVKNTSGTVLYAGATETIRLDTPQTALRGISTSSDK